MTEERPMKTLVRLGITLVRNSEPIELGVKFSVLYYLNLPTL